MGEKHEKHNSTNKQGGAPGKRKTERAGRKSEVPGVPPTDNVRKHPDEVYGDTEIPERGGRLNKIKRESR
jgi:hypothetical protein